MPDGRRLGYAIFGDDAGIPVFSFHGWPGSRLEAAAFANAAVAVGVRLIAPDRPGIGLSDYQQDRRLTDWPADVVALAESLGIDRFRVLGFSGGGPYALAGAALLPERVIAAAHVSGTAPPWPDTPMSLQRGVRATFGIAAHAPLALRALLAVGALGFRYAPDWMTAQMTAPYGAADREALKKTEMQQMSRRALPEAFRQGSAGLATEGRIYTRPWGFELEQIRVPVLLWHGESDENVPPAAARRVAEAIPGCDARFVPDADHLWVFEHAEEVLGALRDTGEA